MTSVIARVAPDDAARAAHPVSDERRQQLLDEMFGRSATAGPAGGWLHPEHIAKIISGLVFAQRPITAASQTIIDEFDLGPRGAFMLSLIDNGAQYPNDLAIVLRIGRSLVTAELARLVEAGLVAGNPGADRRRIRLHLTPLGRSACERLRHGIRTAIEQRLAGYTPDQVELFATMLLRMQQD